VAVRIVTDSTCDLPADTIARYGIRVVPLYINVGEHGFLDGVEMTRQEFYEKLPTFPEHPTTAAPGPEKFSAAYESLAGEGATEVLSIHISISLSAVVDVARVAGKETRSVPVTVFDSRQLSMGTGFLVEKAAILAEQGFSITEIITSLEEQIRHSHVFAALDTLEFLKRSGRMNGILAGLGSFLQIKPILTMFDGKPGAERVRTRERAIRRLLELLQEAGDIQHVALIHTHAPEQEVELRERAAHLLPDGEILTAEITPVIGAHIGPGAVGFAVVAKG